jgi:hypothetical protein
MQTARRPSPRSAIQASPWIRRSSGDGRTLRTGGRTRDWPIQGRRVERARNMINLLRSTGQRIGESAATRGWLSRRECESRCPVSLLGGTSSADSVRSSGPCEFSSVPQSLLLWSTGYLPKSRGRPSRVAKIFPHRPWLTRGADILVCRNRWQTGMSALLQSCSAQGLLLGAFFSPVHGTCRGCGIGPALTPGDAWSPAPPDPRSWGFSVLGLEPSEACPRLKPILREPP